MSANPIPEIKSHVYVPTILTIIWFLLGGLIVYSKWPFTPELKINEIGDALAGFFSPVAFLWLVYGYLQQGRELKLSSDALRLQAQELQNSVQQQKALVEIGQSELAAMQLAMEKQSDQEKEKFRPVFFIQGQGTGSGKQKVIRVTYTIKNTGSTISKFEISSENLLIEPHKYEIFQRDQTIKFSFEIDALIEQNLTITCVYVNGEGVQEKQTAVGLPERGSAIHVFPRFERVPV
ncbi:hypothetical protein [Undibacterium umbellatum]|uniref:Uncharacterized protein n=1 Tax=Undibacterium umbellatum TaxID=2762300 RepID=A0ABR6Z4F1_9BURK|nr:hypothetical protein [Undibacterium umbellatum]MBC3906220.1 hypothetical protein [Undibacterium umbellatum]